MAINAVMYNVQLFAQVYAIWMSRYNQNFIIWTKQYLTIWVANIISLCMRRNVFDRDKLFISRCDAVKRIKSDTQFYETSESIWIFWPPDILFRTSWLLQIGPCHIVCQQSLINKISRVCSADFQRHPKFYTCNLPTRDFCMSSKTSHWSMCKYEIDYLKQQWHRTIS